MLVHKVQQPYMMLGELLLEQLAERWRCIRDVHYWRTQCCRPSLAFTPWFVAENGVCAGLWCGATYILEMLRMYVLDSNVMGADDDVKLYMALGMMIGVNLM